MAVNAIGHNIRKYRNNAGLSIERLAQMIDSMPQYVWKLENRTPQNPSRQKLKLIASALNIPLEYLYLDGEISIEVDDEIYMRKFKSLDAEAKVKIKKIIDIFA